MTSRIVFSEARHTYSLDGKYVPGVTTVINKATAKPGLLSWAAKQTASWAATNRDLLDALGEEEWISVAAKASDRARDAAMSAGNQIHLLAESLVYGHPLPEETAQGLPWPDDVFRTAEQLARFFDAWDVRPVIHEGICFHEDHWWAGRFDLIADLRDRRRWLLDYKTGATGIWSETALQLTAYSRATHVQWKGEDRPMLPTEGTAAVWLRPDSWELIPVRNDDDLYRVFGHAMRVAEWVSTRRETNVFPPLPMPEEASA